MARITKVELEQKLAAAQTELAALRTENSALRTQIEALASKARAVQKSAARSGLSELMVQARDLAARTGKSVLIKNGQLITR